MELLEQGNEVIKQIEHAPTRPVVDWSDIFKPWGAL